MIIWWSFGIVFAILLQYVIAIIRIKFFWKNHRKELHHDFPNVSVLVAARNEERDLPKLLRSFEQLNYPAENIQFLFADDQSLDSTAGILYDWCSAASNRTSTTITSAETAKYNTNGKANALAILGEKATGEFYFFTDADCEVNPNWILEGVNSFSGNIGLVIGITQVQSKSLLGKFQEIDWWVTLGFVKVAADLHIQTTGLGNNMVISQKAYQQSEGFKRLPFCLTEDLEISRSIQREGFTIAHQVSQGMLVRTKSETTYRQLLQQRKRWMSGIMTLPFYWKVLVALQFGYFLGIISLLVISPFAGISLGLLKMLLQSIFLSAIAGKVKVKLKWLRLMIFDFYNFNTILLTILYYFWPSKTKWKSRTYE